MCPYCGEDVPDDSSACWKCGTEISKGEGGGGAPDGEELSQRNVESKSGPKTECPFCQALIPARALRCNECGRVLQRSGARANWVPAAWAAFGLVILATLVAVVLSFVRAHKPAADPGRDAPVSKRFSELERIYLKGAASNEQRRRDIWNVEHAGKFVEWEGVIVSVDAAARKVSLAEDGLSGVATVVVEMKPEVDFSGLKEEKAIRYSARLEDFREGQFHLSLGTLLD
jgi:predicted nucleic acid-binding Zn ribbon protein/Cu/Ag efflux protein CusF